MIWRHLQDYLVRVDVNDYEGFWCQSVDMPIVRGHEDAYYFWFPSHINHIKLHKYTITGSYWYYLSTETLYIWILLMLATINIVDFSFQWKQLHYITTTSPWRTIKFSIAVPSSNTSTIDKLEHYFLWKDS